MKKILSVLCLSLALGTAPVYAAEIDENAAVVNEIEARGNSYAYGSKTISGKTTILYIGNTTSKSVSFSKSSKTSGYFSITNNSGGTITVTSASVYY